MTGPYQSINVWLRLNFHTVFISSSFGLETIKVCFLVCACVSVCCFLSVTAFRSGSWLSLLLPKTWTNYWNFRILPFPLGVCVSISHYNLQFMAKLCSRIYCINYVFRTEVINLIFLLQIFLVNRSVFWNYYFTLLNTYCLNIDFIQVKFVIYLLCRQMGNCWFTTGVCYTMCRVSMFIVTTT